MQDQGEGLRPVAFMSRAFKPTEQRYSAYEREMAAVAYSVSSNGATILEGCLAGCHGGGQIISTVDITSWINKSFPGHKRRRI